MLNYEFPPLGGGGGVASHTLAKGFIAHGFKVDFVTSRNRGLKKFEVIDGINIYRTYTFGRKDLATSTFISMASFVVTGFFKGFYLCLKNKYIFVNTHFVVPTGPVGYVLALIFRIKNILSLHGGDIYDPTKKLSPHRIKVLRIVVKFLLERAYKIVAQSTFTQRNAVKYYNPKNEISIIPLPYEHFNFEKVDRKKLGLSENKKYIIGIGRLVKAKGFEYFIEALSLLSDMPVEGLIIGDGPERENLLNLAEELKVKDRIHFLGRKIGEEKFQYLDSADIYVSSSVQETFGIVLQEAMQVGLPIVATRNEGPASFIKEGVNGLLVELRDPKELSEKIRVLISDTKLQREMSEKNKSDINNFDFKKISEQYINLLK